MSSILKEIERSSSHVSYDTLFNTHSRLIYKIIYSFFESSNLKLHDTEIDDIYQEIALKIIKNDYLNKYNDQKSSFITWINIICRTTILDYYRKRMRLMEGILSEQPPQWTEDGHEEFEFSLPAGILTDRQEQVVTLFFRDGLVAREIASKLEIKPRTVRSIKFQALERLRSHYGMSPQIDDESDSSESRRKVS